MSEVHIVALLYPGPGKAERMTELLKGMCKNVHEKEPDAHRYLMTTELDKDEPTIVMVETYKNKQVATEHGETNYFKELFAKFDDEGLSAKPAQVMFTKSTAGFDLDRKLL